MAKTRNKEAHNALLKQYIKAIENPNRHGFIDGKWVKSPYKGDDPNNRGYGVDVVNNKAASKLVKDRPEKWLSEDEERMLRNKHIKDVNKIVNDHYFPYLRRTPLSEEKEMLATGLLYRGDHINGTKLADPYYNGSNTEFQRAVEDYYRSKNLNDRAWRSKEFVDTHKAVDAPTSISLESSYVPMEYIGYHPNEEYYYAGELPQTDVFGEYKHAEGGMLYSGQEDMSYTPQEEYQDEYQNNIQDTPQEKPRQWDELSLSEKNAFIASAVKHGITNMEDIKRTYNELSQEQVNDTPEEEEDGNKFLKGGYKPSRKIRNYIANKEGASMKTNRSFEAEAKDFWSVMPEDVRSRLTQEQADALYSYSYNVGAINFKHRVVPALQRYFSGNGSVEDVQKHMYATKDSQLRGLAKRRAEERAMFAGSSVPVYSDSPYADSGNTWRSSRLGPVTSINMSKGLGVVNNNSGLLGPVSNERQDNAFMQEAINTLYDDSKPTLMEVPHEEQSSLDRYNAIQDYLSSLNPFGYARGGRMYDKGGVTSSNGQYHVEPSEYSEVLDSAANGNPLEVTLPDTTVTAADPMNYRSYYDPNGFMDFANVVTLGLPNRGSVSQDLGLLRDAYDAFKGNKSWEDVGLSAIMGNRGVFNNPYANLALDFAVPMGVYGAAKLKSPKFISELDWSPESWFSKRAGGKYDAEDVKALKSHVPEYLDIEKKAKADGTWLKMADGTTWQGDPRSWVQLQSKKVQEMNPEQFWTGVGQDINPTYNGILWGTYGKGKTPAIKAREYALSDNHLLPMITPKNSTTSTYNANNSWWKDIDKKALGYDDYQGKIKTDDLVRASQRAGDRITKIEKVIDPGPNIVPKKSSFYVGGISNNWLIPQNDIILRDGTVRKSLLGNNGNFDWINPNIYKGLLPLAGLYYLDKKE